MGDLMDLKMTFAASEATAAQQALSALLERYEHCDEQAADVVVALGGDGFMLQTLQRTQGLELPVYGMNRGTIGFLMNDFSLENLPQRVSEAERTTINPLAMKAKDTAGQNHVALAINEVSLLRVGPQAAHLRVFVDDRARLQELVCDGALLATPAGSTAYNYSAHGPILPIGSDVLALTAMAAYRPRRWRGALLPKSASVRFDVLEPQHRPVTAYADSLAVENVVSVHIRSEVTVHHQILFDPGHGLEERLLREQFV